MYNSTCSFRFTQAFYGVENRMERRTILIKPASSLCNMRCRYCFYADVSDHRAMKHYGIMDEKVSEKVIDAACQDIEPGGSVTFAFQGGEPTLAGLDFFRHFVKYANHAAKNRKIYTDFTIQTNGLLIDHAWTAFLKENHFLVGLSMDGPSKYHDRYRVDCEGEGTWKRVSDTADLLKNAGVEFSVEDTAEVQKVEMKDEVPTALLIINKKG